MIDENALADNLISARSKRSKSYHSEDGGLTYGEITRRANTKPPDVKARQMKKLIEQGHRLSEKPRRPHS
jgi:hypothetical protein